MSRHKNPSTIKKELIKELADDKKHIKLLLERMFANYTPSEAASGLKALKECGLKGQEIEEALWLFQNDGLFFLNRPVLQSQDLAFNQIEGGQRSLLESIADPDFVARVKRIIPDQQAFSGKIRQLWQLFDQENAASTETSVTRSPR